jgi:hypothetical protein
MWRLNHLSDRAYLVITTCSFVNIVDMIKNVENNISYVVSFYVFLVIVSCFSATICHLLNVTLTGAFSPNPFWLPKKDQTDFLRVISYQWPQSRQLKRWLWSKPTLREAVSATRPTNWWGRRIRRNERKLSFVREYIWSHCGIKWPNRRCRCSERENHLGGPVMNISSHIGITSFINHGLELSNRTLRHSTIIQRHHYDTQSAQSTKSIDERTNYDMIVGRAGSASHTFGRCTNLLHIQTSFECLSEDQATAETLLMISMLEFCKSWKLSRGLRFERWLSSSRFLRRRCSPSNCFSQHEKPTFQIGSSMSWWWFESKTIGGPQHPLDVLQAQERCDLRNRITENETWVDLDMKSGTTNPCQKDNCKRKVHTDHFMGNSRDRTRLLDPKR